MLLMVMRHRPLDQADGFIDIKGLGQVFKSPALIG